MQLFVPIEIPSPYQKKAQNCEEL